MITEPPITRDIPDAKLDDFIKERASLNVEKYPLHTQAVERSIKLISEASLKVCGYEAREQFIKTRIASRNRIKIFESKKDYVI